MITLNLCSLPVARETLCTHCVFSHIVRGFRPREEVVFCGYTFPLRELLFEVRECTDFRAARKPQPCFLTAREA